MYLAYFLKQKKNTSYSLIKIIHAVPFSFPIEQVKFNRLKYNFSGDLLLQKKSRIFRVQ